MAMVLDTEASMERERLRLSLRLMPSTWLLPTPVTMATMAMLPPMLATLLDMVLATLDTPTLLPMAMETLAMLDMVMVLDTGDSMERERLRLSPSLLLPMLAMLLVMATATLDSPTLVPMDMVLVVLVLAIPTVLLLEPAETTLELPFPANL